MDGFISATERKKKITPDALGNRITYLMDMKSETEIEKLYNKIKNEE